MSAIQKFRTLHGRRQARPLTDNQKKLLENLYPKFELNEANATQIKEKIILEIGFGSGENIAFQATKNPNETYVGCEPFINGVVSLLQKIEADKINNIFIWEDDASLLLNKLTDQSIKEVFILFPDPWPKKRHHKRRFINLNNLLLLHKKLIDGGILQIATDHADYLNWILDVTNNEEFKKSFNTLHNTQMSRPDFSEIPQTRFEAKGVKANHRISFLKFSKNPTN